MAYLHGIQVTYYDVRVKRDFAPDYDADRSTLTCSRALKHSQSATFVAACSCLAGPNPTFVGASSTKWAFDPCII